jgi:hypothetical protein
MKQTALILIFCSFLFGSCTKERKSITPACIESKIETFSIVGNSCETGASVKEYNFQGKLVYVFSMGFCGGDLSAAVLDADCNSLGGLGGYLGNTRINGVEFSIAVYKRTVWER